MEVFVIITQPKCGWCDKAKVLISQNNDLYAAYNLSEHPWLKTLFKKTNLTTVPQIFTSDGTLIGGYEELEKWYKEKKV